MNKEALLQRKSELEGLRKEYEASFHKIVGAIEDCEYWLNWLDGAPDQESGEDNE